MPYLGVSIFCLSEISKRFRKKWKRVMGGFGSGRIVGSGRDAVEACHSLDVNRLHRAGCLHPGWSGGWQWTQDGERTGWINLASGV